MLVLIKILSMIVVTDKSGHGWKMKNLITKAQQVLRQQTVAKQLTVLLIRAVKKTTKLPEVW